MVRVAKAAKAARRHGGEEAATQYGLNDVYDVVRSGARLILRYDAASESFVGSVTNTTAAILRNVRIEIHLSNGTELGPTTPIDLGAGFADSLTVSAHDLALPVAALFLQLGIEGVPARKPGTRHHKVPPGVANHPFYIAFIVALAGAAVAVLEQVMGLQPAERPGPLPRAVRQDARHQALVVVVENRLGNPAAEGKGRIVPVQPSLRPTSERSARRLVAVKSTAGGSPQISAITPPRDGQHSPCSAVQSAHRAFGASTLSTSTPGRMPARHGRPASRRDIRSCTQSTGLLPGPSWASTNPVTAPSMAVSAKTSESMAGAGSACGRRHGRSRWDAG